MRVLIRAPWSSGQLKCTEVSIEDQVDDIVFRCLAAWPETNEPCGDAIISDHTSIITEAGNCDQSSHKPCTPWTVTLGGRVLPRGVSIRDAGVQRDSVLCVTGTLKGGMLAMQIAYRRAKEARQRSTNKNSEFMKVISDVRLFFF